jgi:N-acetylglucosamine-6-sulfatase
MRPSLLFALLFALFLAACSQPSSSSPSGDAPPSGDSPLPPGVRPNIVFVLADDLDVGVYSHMMRLHALMDAKGLAFDQHFINVSLCCPSRTAILRGQYAHNTQIFGNSPPLGGFEPFYAHHSENDTLPVWLSAAGYRTVAMGKYLNGYPNSAPADYVPPGWTEWYSPVAGNPYSDYNYTMNENGHEVSYLMRPKDYMPDVLTNMAVDFIQRTSAMHQPFFMYITPYVPHSPATPAPRYANDFAGVKAPRTATFDQADVSEMPPWVRALPRLTQKQIDAIDVLYRKRLQSMEAVEDMVQQIVTTLEATGELDHTYIVFTSDNGFHQGQHRLPSGKNTEFDEDLLVPFVVRGPGIPAGATTDAPTVNCDFAPTFLELAGAAIPPGVDGRSLVPLLSGTAPATWRKAVLLEHADEVADPEPALRRSVLSTLEPADTLEEAAGTVKYSPPAFVGVRTAKYTYVRYAGGAHALFDHDADPAQMHNVYATASSQVLAPLEAVANALNGCHGAECRTAEEMP